MKRAVKKKTLNGLVFVLGRGTSFPLSPFAHRSRLGWLFRLSLDLVSSLDSISSRQKESRVNEDEDPKGKGDQHSIEDVEEGLVGDNLALPSVEEFDSSVDGSESASEGGRC